MTFYLYLYKFNHTVHDVDFFCDVSGHCGNECCGRHDCSDINSFYIPPTPTGSCRFDGRDCFAPVDDCYYCSHPYFDKNHPLYYSFRRDD